MTARITSSLKKAQRFVANLGVPTLRRFQRDPLGTLISLHERGGVVPFRMGGLQFHLLTEPADIEWLFRQRSDVLLKDSFTQQLGRILGEGLLVTEGELWRRQRGLMAHAFTPKRIAAYGDAMATIAAGFATKLEDGQVVDIHQAMNHVTMEIVAKTLFDSDVSAKGGAVGHALEQVMEFFANSPEAVFALPDWFPSARMRRFVEGRATIEHIVEELIDQRRAEGTDRGDLLSAMLASQEQDGSRMSDAQLRDECVTLFLAGHETTSLLLAHTFVLLSEYPEVARRLREELDRVVGDRPVAVGDVKALVTMEQVLAEVLRIRPSAWVTGREVSEGFERDGVRFEAGDQLMVSQWASHRDPRYYPNPEAFVPERWTPAFKKSLPRGAYFPFGDGPRVCIGNHFANLEAVLILASVLQRWQLDLLPGARLAFAPSVTLRPRQHVSMRVRSRPPIAPVSRRAESARAS